MLVNNAGVMLLGPIDGAPTEEWRRTIHVNVMGRPVLHARGLPLMKPQGAGDTVNADTIVWR